MLVTLTTEQLDDFGVYRRNLTVIIQILLDPTDNTFSNVRNVLNENIVEHTPDYRAETQGCVATRRHEIMGLSLNVRQR